MESLAAFRRKQPYLPPQVRKLNRDQAALFLLGHAWNGDENAKEVLEKTVDLLFPDPTTKGNGLNGKPLS